MPQSACRLARRRRNAGNRARRILPQGRTGGVQALVLQRLLDVPRDAPIAVFGLGEIGRAMLRALADAGFTAVESFNRASMRAFEGAVLRAHTRHRGLRRAACLALACRPDDGRQVFDLGSPLQLVRGARLEAHRARRTAGWQRRGAARRPNTPRSMPSARPARRRSARHCWQPPPSDTLAAMTAMRTEFMQNKLPGLLEGLPPQRARKLTSESERDAARVHLARRGARRHEASTIIGSPRQRPGAVAIAHRARGAGRAAPAPAWHPDITVIATRGDLDQSPLLVGKMEKGFFTRELEVALLDRRIDLVVHSLKDLPTATPDGLAESHHPAARQRRPTGCWCAANSLRRATMACCRSRPARASALVAAPRRLVRPLRTAGGFGAAARQRAHAPAQARRRAERRRHRAGGRRAHAPRAGPVRVRGGRAAARMVDSGAGAGRAGRAVPRRRSRKSKRRSRCSPTPPASRPRAGNANSCASSRAVAPRLSAATSSAGARTWASPPSAAGPRAASTYRKILLEESQRDSFIREAVAGCQPIDLSETATRALSRALLAR